MRAGEVGIQYGEFKNDFHALSANRSAPYAPAPPLSPLGLSASLRELVRTETQTRTQKNKKKKSDGGPRRFFREKSWIFFCTRFFCRPLSSRQLSTNGVVSVCFVFMIIALRQMFSG